MIGNIQSVKTNQNGAKTFGFILGDDNQEYFFFKSELKNCTIYQLEDGDAVEFKPEILHDGRLRATEVRKRSASSSAKVTTSVTPGMNPNLKLNHLNSEQRTIVEKYLQKVFYVTNGGQTIYINNCSYNFILIKPTDVFRTLFNLTREIVVVFSDYVNFEHRSLDAASEAVKYVPATLRLDRGCHILISNDSNVEQGIYDLFKDTNHNSIVIPFSYHEFLSGKMDNTAVIDRFKKYLFDADLFSPRQDGNDLFFFGRRDYVQDIAAKCKMGVHCGVFGLRRSGKTSLLHAVRRKLTAEGYRVVYIYCPKDISEQNWKSALHVIVKKVQETLQFDPSMLSSEESYKKNNAHAYFESDMNTMLDGMSYPIILLFDEIESITFDVHESKPSWREGCSFKDFWNVLKGYYSAHLQKVTIVVAGTNPMINEEPIMKLSQQSNPMYGQLSTSNQGAYLPPFDIDSTKEMINTLGAYMGIQFNDAVVAAITEDCGGHPYLIRLLCGAIRQYIHKEKKTLPIEVSKGIYEAARNEFEKSTDAEGFYLMILHILQTSYTKEYNTLRILATDGDSMVAQMADNMSLGRLLGYGLIENNAGHYAIRFDTLKRFLQNTYRFEREKMSIKEQKEEINYRFDAAEQQLRSVIRRELRSSFKEAGAKQAFILAMQKNSAVKPHQVQQASNLTYKQLFDPTMNSGCFFSVLIDVIYENYSEFENTFEENRDVVKNHLVTLNRARRLPSHSAPEGAEKWTIDDFKKFRTSMTWLERILENAD